MAAYTLHYGYVYSAYADDTTLFQKDVNSTKEMVNSFHIFSRFSGLKLNISKCEISGIGVLKGVKVDLVLDTIKILGTHFSYNEKWKEERNICLIIANIQFVLKLWKIRNLTLEGKIPILKTLASPKIVFQAFDSTNTNVGSYWNRKKDKQFLWQNSGSKMKHDTFCNDNKHVGLKNVNTWKKVINLQCLWIKRLYDDSFHERKVISLQLFSRTFGKSFLLHSNFSFQKEIN